MDYRYIFVIASLLSPSPVFSTTPKDKQSSSPNSKEKLKHIPSIPEISSNIKDPSRWKNGTRMIFFYSPWCDHSNTLRPKLYEVIEELYYRNVSDLLVGQIDISVKSDVVRTFRIKTTPTLLLFQNGTRYEFDDEPSVNNIVNFVLRIMSPSVSEVHLVSELRALQVNHPVLFLLVYDEEVDPDWRNIYTQVSKERVLIGTFLYTTNTSIPREMGLSLPSLPRLIVLKEGKVHQYTDTLTKYRMTLWVENEQFPALPFTNRTTFRPILTIGHLKRIAVLHLSALTNIPLNQRKALEAIRRVAEGRKLHSGYQFTVLDDEELIYRMTDSHLAPPSFFVWDKRTGQYYLFDPSEQGGFSEKSISSFLFSITSGKIKESGGLSLSKMFTHYYWIVYNLMQAMISHRPALSVLAIASICAGLTICMWSRARSKKAKALKKRLKIRKVARREERLRRRRREHEEQDEGERESQGEEEEEEEFETNKNK